MQNNVLVEWQIQNDPTTHSKNVKITIRRAPNDRHPNNYTYT